MEPDKLKQIVEAALLAADEPLTIDQLAKLFKRGEVDASTIRADLREALKTLEAEAEGRGWELKRVASGFRYQVRQELSVFVSRLWEEKPPRYTRALLETLALVSYKQPVTRGDIEQVRGVSVSQNIMRTLLERGWIRVVGQREVPGKPAMYGTTKAFLDYFNLKSLDELPPLAEIRELIEPLVVEEAVAPDGATSDSAISESATPDSTGPEVTDEAAADGTANDEGQSEETVAEVSEVEVSEVDVSEVEVSELSEPQETPGPSAGPEADDGGSSPAMERNLEAAEEVGAEAAEDARGTALDDEALDAELEAAFAAADAVSARMDEDRERAQVVDVVTELEGEALEGEEAEPEQAVAAAANAVESVQGAGDAGASAEGESAPRDSESGEQSAANVVQLPTAPR